jgi:toxin ParE1/3/4
MKLYHLVPEAEEDLIREYEYVYLQNPPAAERLVEQFTHAFRHLGGWPESGRLRPDLSNAENPVRSWIVGKYLILYDAQSTPLRILAILHGAQDLNRIFKERYLTE